MRVFLIILACFVCSVGKPQKSLIQLIFPGYGDDFPRNDTSLQYNLEFLSKYPEFGAMSCERVGDAYSRRGDYQRAIQYYDSVESKYYWDGMLCGNGHSYLTQQLQLKIADRFKRLGMIDSSISRLTRLVFTHRILFASTIKTYKEYLLIKYSRREIRKKIKEAVNSINVDYQLAKNKNCYSETFITIRLFNTDMVIYSCNPCGFESCLPTKEQVIDMFKGYEVYRMLVGEAKTSAQYQYVIRW